VKKNLSDSSRKPSNGILRNLESNQNPADESALCLWLYGLQLVNGRGSWTEQNRGRTGHGCMMTVEGGHTSKEGRTAMIPMEHTIPQDRLHD
jgi:hypothetical protein